MRLSTLPRFLIGQREAIRDIAHGRHALAVGLLFVIGASIARTWDTTDLVDKPQVLARPIIASLITSSVIGVLFWCFARMFGEHRDSYRGRLFECWGAMIAIFWWTAPLAWLYAVPVERFLPARESVDANVVFLLIVSVWRVVLAIRAGCVIYGFGGVATSLVLLFIADLIVIAAIATAPVPVFFVMSGIDPNDVESSRANSLFMLQTFAMIGAVPLGLIGVGAAFALRATRPWEAALRAAPSPAVWIVACVAPFTFIPGLMVVQPELRMATRYEIVRRDADVDATVDLLGSHSKAAFPPHWRPGVGEVRAPWSPRSLAELQWASAVREALEPGWARERIDRAIDRALLARVSMFSRSWGRFHHLDPEDWDEAWPLIERHLAASTILTDDEREDIRELIARREEMSAKTPVGSDSPQR